VRRCDRASRRPCLLRAGRPGRSSQSGPDHLLAYEADQVPLGRIGNADEVARWIALLLSPVSSFMTGAVIPLDGGQVIPRA
jgi:NAD(P)-dependent dehydrogenase (short-subunit alcohol dehydrogenase family)